MTCFFREIYDLRLQLDDEARTSDLYGLHPLWIELSVTYGPIQIQTVSFELESNFQFKMCGFFQNIDFFQKVMLKY